MFKDAFLQTMSISWKLYDRFFSNFGKQASELSCFISSSLKSIVTNRCTKCWSNLIFKCNANAFVKVDAQIGEERRRTIRYLQGYSCPTFYCKKLSNQKPTANTVRNTRRTILC